MLARAFVAFKGVPDCAAQRAASEKHEYGEAPRSSSPGASGAFNPLWKMREWAKRGAPAGGGSGE
jgi:hypothetical protein